MNLNEAKGSMCCVLFPRRDGVSPKDCDGCILKRGHLGPHRFCCGKATYEWETDMECDCEDCQSDESADWCIVYRRML